MTDNQIWVIGGGGHARCIVDVIISNNDLVVAGFFDDLLTTWRDSHDILYCGKIDDIENILPPHGRLICGLGDITVRKEV